MMMPLETVTERLYVLSAPVILMLAYFACKFSLS